jgi:pimeloyl-ACP methyl ester carboxylesterase
MSAQTITTKDGTRIYYKDWGHGQPVVFSHGWPLSSDAWEDQMFYLASRGYRCIAHDRRGHWRSGQPWDGNDMDTYADDLAELVQTLDLRDAVHLGHSTGGGEVVLDAGMMAGFPAAYYCIKAFSESDQAEDLKRIDVPTLIIQGDDDQIVPFANAGQLQSRLVKGATLKVYKGAPHGLCTTHKDQVNEDLLAFLRS